MTLFSQMTREELIAAIIKINDPDVVGDSETLMVFGLATESDNPCGVTLRDGTYMKSDIRFEYFDEGNLDLLKDTEVEITQAEYHAIIEEDLGRYTTSQLRIELKQAEYEQFFIKERNEYKEKYKHTLKALNSLANSLLKDTQ